MNINEKGQIVAEFNGVVYNMRLRKNNHDRTIVLDPKNKSQGIIKGGDPSKCSTLPPEILAIIIGYADPKTVASMLIAMKNLPNNDAVCGKMDELKSIIDELYDDAGPLYRLTEGQHNQDTPEYDEIVKQLEEKRENIKQIMNNAIGPL